jgi:site-specific recombinase XerD
MDQAIAKFKDYLERRYPDRSTAKHYISDLLIFRQFAGPVKPPEITAKMVDEFVQAQSQQGLKPATLNRRLASLASFIDFLIDEAEADDWQNPVRWKRHRIKPGRHLPRDVSDETVRRLFAVLDDRRDRAIFSLMVSAGLRVGEVVRLQLADLPSVETTILSRLRVNGKGDKDRLTWLTQAALEPLQAWLAQRPPGNCQHLFLNQHGQPLSVAGVEYRLKQYCQQAQVQLTCHQLRHTFARRLAEQGMPIESLAKLLGHQSIQTTQLYIDGADPTVRQDFLRALEQASPAWPDEPTGTSAQGVPAAGPTRSERLDPVALVDQLSHLTAALPAWLQPALRSYLISRVNRWQPHQARLHAQNRLASLARTCRWLVQKRHWSSLDQLQRADLSAYVQACQARGLKPQSIATELKVFGGFWCYLIDQEQVTNGAILRVKAPPPNRDPLPRYLNPLEFQRLEQAVLADTGAGQPQDHFQRACFYLLAHAGLRRGELLNLRLADCDLTGRRLRVQAGKGDRDRVLPMSDRLVTVLAAYVAVRQPAPTDHLLIYRGAPVSRFLIARHLNHWAQLAEITNLYPHRLRHTLATLLVNQGMPIISLQKFLGHQDINNTLIYARVYDETVRRQFAAAMAQIEGIPVTDWPGQLEPLQPTLILAPLEAATQCNEVGPLSAE